MSRHRMLFASLLLMIATLPTPAFAQVPAKVTPVKLENRTIQVRAGRMEVYRRLYFAGESSSLADSLRKDLGAVAIADAGESRSFESAYRSVVFVARPPAQKDRTVVRFLLPPEDRPVGPQHLPGEELVYEVLLSLDSATAMESSWVSSLEASPLQDQFVALAQAALSVGAGIVPEVFPEQPFVRDATLPLQVAIHRVDLPHKRATLKVTTRVTNPVVQEPGALRKSAQELSAMLARGSARLSPCAIKLSNRLEAAVVGAAPDAGGNIDSAARKRIGKALDTATTRVLALPPCVGEARGTGTLTVARASAVTDVATRFMALASTGADPLTSATDIRNVPLSHWSVSLMGGVTVSRGGDTNFELSDGAPRRKELSGAVTAAALHWHWGYDPAAPEMSVWERLSPFLAFIATPSPGIGLGGNFRPMRGFGVQVMYGWMRAESLRSGFVEGEAIAPGADPFDLGWTRAWTLGISYNIK